MSWLPEHTNGHTPIVPRLVRCRSREFPACFNVQFICPLFCPFTCMVDCHACKPVCKCDYPGAVCQDPRFVGGDGITFYFHGHKDHDFCLVSEPNLHINAHFIGKRNPNLKRDFTWVQSIGILFDRHKLLLAAERTSTWDDNVDRLSISLDDNPISVPTTEGHTWRSPDAPIVTITRPSDTNRVTVEVANSLRVTAVVVPITAHESRVHGYNITEDDCFAHLELGFKFFNLSDKVDGVLGQTYRRDYVSKAKVNAPMPVMGGARRFSSSSIFATDCGACRFGSEVDSNNNGASQFPTLQCLGGETGRGVVCKR
ncbi:hypothetical protein NMG60_11022062 [Bertholletia excelsa]